MLSHVSCGVIALFCARIMQQLRDWTRLSFSFNFGHYGEPVEAAHHCWLLLAPTLWGLTLRFGLL
jgi:hypothetical protein